jgi:hypothetical protein
MLVFWVDDENGTNGQGQAHPKTSVDHTVGRADGAVGIRNNGKLDFNVVFAMSNDVAEPIVVRLDGIERVAIRQSMPWTRPASWPSDQSRWCKPGKAGGKQEGFPSLPLRNESIYPP